MNATTNTSRLHVIDALRGFAIVTIMLLHNLEHFDVYFAPENLPAWMVSMDKMVWDSLFFLFAGKSYAIFALLFGLTFFIQSDNQEKRGNDFRARFAWRLVLLLIFGFINSLFYQGDILMLYAAIGFFLIPVAKLSNKLVLCIAIFLFLQPFEMVKLIYAIQNPDIKLSNPLSWAYFGNMNQYIKDSSFINTLAGNITNGKLAVMNWCWENGRFFHILSLFMFGMLSGRKKLFAISDKNKIFWIRTLIFSSLTFIPLFIIQRNIGNIFSSEAIKRSFSTIETSWTNISFMLVLVSGFVLLFQTKYFHKALNIFSPIGRMSLSNYVFQSILGSSIYYGFGLGLYQYTGATYSLLIAISLAIFLGLFCTWWAKNHKRGPLESIWHKATWITLKRSKKSSVQYAPVYTQKK